MSVQMVPCDRCENFEECHKALRCARPSGPVSGSVGQHPWADSTGEITAKSAGTAVANMILTAGAKASTAFRCALEIAQDIENHPERYKLKGPRNPERSGGTSAAACSSEA